MKKLIFRLTLPLTLISFGFITKWSYGIAVDAKDVFFYGFPMIYKCEGFHASLSTQYFLIEMGINLLTYFVFWLVMTLTLNRIWKINIAKSRRFFIIKICFVCLRDATPSKICRKRCHSPGIYSANLLERRS